MATILIVEDEQTINTLVQRNLQLVGHRCIPALDGEEALSVLERSHIDLILLDIMLPGKDGFEVKRLTADIPTIFLTARDGLSDRITGFNLGADDYLVKPFEMLELLARVEAVLRRTQNTPALFEAARVRINFDSREVFRDNRPVELTPKEFELLEMLVRNRNIALSRDRLVESVWGYDFLGDTRTVDVHIQKLRKKLGWNERIKTVYKLGYQLEVKP